MKLIQRLLGGLLIGMLCSCSTMQITSDYDPSGHFSGLKTYDWHPVPQKPTGNPRLDNTLLENRIRNAVESQLGQQGYQKLTTGTPDFWIGYHVAIENKIDVTTMNQYYNYPPGWAYRNYGVPYNAPGVTVTQTQAYEYEQGTLILDIVDPQTQQLIWRGSAQAELDRTASPEKREKRLKDAIRRILERFPPK
jgi:hypothetical protein